MILHHRYLWLYLVECRHGVLGALGLKLIIGLIFNHNTLQTSTLTNLHCVSADKEKEEEKIGFHRNGFNQFRSDRIPYDREVPDTRDPR